MYVHRIAGGKIVEEWSEGDIGPFQERLDEEMRERERVEQEMRVARTIQQANLPKEVPTLEGWKIAPHCQPAREVGGDFTTSTNHRRAVWDSWWEPVEHLQTH
jgi:hypothetical protein